jgi:hypothetical protein
MVDYGAPGVAPDGLMDTSFRYNDVTGDWPFGERWQGTAAIDEYSFAGDFTRAGSGFLCRAA